MQTAFDLNIPELFRLNNALNLKVNPSVEGEGNLSSANSRVTVEYQHIDVSSFIKENDFGWAIKKAQPQFASSSLSVLLLKPYNTAHQPYINPLMDLALCLTTTDDLETDLVKYFKGFDKVKQIFISESKETKGIRISLDMNEYDIDYMEQLFSQAQFPIQDKYSNQNIMLNFEYIFSNDNPVEENYNYLGRSIYTSIANV